MKKCWGLFPVIVALVERAHKDVHGGHDIWHAKRVAYWAYKIAMNEYNDERVAQLAWLAGLCHNMDRLLERSYGRGNVPDGATQKALLAWLDKEHPTAFADGEKDTVVKAVVGHSKKNDTSHSPVQICLMDADKVVNCARDLIPRSGAHYHDLPVVDFIHFVSDPTATYQDPKSVLKDIWYTVAEWVDPNCPFCFRTKLGWEIGKKRVEYLKQYIDGLKEDLEEDGIVFQP